MSSPSLQTGTTALVGGLSVGGDAASVASHAIATTGSGAPESCSSCAACWRGSLSVAAVGGAASQHVTVEVEPSPCLSQGGFESEWQHPCALACATQATAGAIVPKRTNPITSTAISRRNTIQGSTSRLALLRAKDARGQRFGYFPAASQLGCAPGLTKQPSIARRRAAQPDQPRTGPQAVRHARDDGDAGAGLEWRNDLECSKTAAGQQQRVGRRRRIAYSHTELDEIVLAPAAASCSAAAGIRASTLSKPSGVMRSTPSPVTTKRKRSPYIAMPSSGTARPAGGKIKPRTGTVSGALARRMPISGGSLIVVGARRIPEG